MSETNETPELTRRDWAKDAVLIPYALLKLVALPSLITLVTWPGVEEIFVDTYLVGTAAYPVFEPITAPAAVIGTWIGLMYLELSWIGRHKSAP